MIWRRWSLIIMYFIKGRRWKMSYTFIIRYIARHRNNFHCSLKWINRCYSLSSQYSWNYSLFCFLSVHHSGRRWKRILNEKLQVQLINIVQMVEHLVKQGKPIINHKKQLANLMKNKANSMQRGELWNQW